MGKPWALTMAAALGAVLAGLPGAFAAELNPRLAVLRPLLGTWRGEFANGAPEKPVFDVSRFEAALNGQAVRNLHSVDDGAYGGETILFWDEERQSIVFYYFTTAGFHTTGTVREEGGAVVAHETVKGKAGGVTEVTASFRILPDGRLQVKTRHRKDGRWEDARDMVYAKVPGAEVKFKD